MLQGRPDDLHEIRRVWEVPSRPSARRGMHEGTHQHFEASEFATDHVIREPFARRQDSLTPVPNIGSLKDDDCRLEKLEGGLEVAFAISHHHRSWSSAGRAEAVRGTEEPVEDCAAVEDVDATIGKFYKLIRVNAVGRELEERLQCQRRTPEVGVAPFVSAVRDQPSVQSALVVYRLVATQHVRPLPSSHVRLPPDDHGPSRLVKSVHDVEMSADVREVTFRERAAIRRRSLALGSTGADEVVAIEHVLRHVILQGLDPRSRGLGVREEGSRVSCRR
jgi:hypothetical protein